MSNVNINDLVLGEIVIPSFSEANQQTARDCADHLGITSDLNMPRCALRNLLVKAVKAVNRKNKEYSVEQIHEGPNKVQYVIVRKDIRDRGQDHDGNVIKDPDLGVEARFYFSKENRDKGKPAEECVNFFQDEFHPIAQAIRSEYYAQAVIFNSDDMRRSTNNMLTALGAVQITRGNTWFVPRQQKEMVSKLQEWLNWNNCSVARYTQLDIDGTKDALQDVVQDGLTGNINALKEQIQACQVEAKTRVSTVEKRMNDIKNMRSTVDLYSRAIGMDFDEMKQDIEQLEKDLADYLLGRVDNE